MYFFFALETSKQRETIGEIAQTTEHMLSMWGPRLYLCASWFPNTAGSHPGMVNSNTGDRYCLNIATDSSKLFSPPYSPKSPQIKK